MSTGRGNWIVSGARRLLAAAALALAVPGPAAGEEGALDPLAGTAFGWLASYVGKITAMPMTASVRGDSETCSAVVVAPQWVLTAAHCVHVKNPAGKPWTPQYFVRMYPLERLFFAPAPIGRAQLYRIVAFVKSDRFPELEAAAEDWIFLKLHRPLPVDPTLIPVVVPSREDQAGRDIRITGFLRSYDERGALDLSRSNEPRVSRASCRIEAYGEPITGSSDGLIDIDCIPAVNYGLSGGPLFAIEPGQPFPPRVIGIQMGAGPAGALRRQVPVLVRSEQFLAAYRRIVGGSGGPPAGIAE